MVRLPSLRKETEMAFRKYSAEKPSAVKVAEEERKAGADGEGEGSEQVVDLDESAAPEAAPEGEDRP